MLLSTAELCEMLFSMRSNLSLVFAGIRKCAVAVSTMQCNLNHPSCFFFPMQFIAEVAAKYAPPVVL